MSKVVNHIVKRPGRRHGDPETEIPIAQDLVTVPGSPNLDGDVSYYSREFPIESQTVEKIGRPRLGLDRLHQRSLRLPQEA